jgi:voltage-gated potassium channel
MQAVRRRLQIFLVLFVVVTAVGTAGFMALEELSFPEALYYNIVTMSTVGYGDIHPTNNTSRLFAVLLIIMGAGTFIGVIANATEMILLRRDAQHRLRKINMVRGIFFNEVGYDLLRLFSSYDRDMEKTRNRFIVNADWSDRHFSAVQKVLKKHAFHVDADCVDVVALFDLLEDKRDCIARLLENPVLVEHEEFTEVLLSVFHLTDELTSREALQDLPRSDVEHLVGDISRAYRLLVEQWFMYLRHVKGEYPYLYSLAVRKNPFDEDATPVVG